MSLVTQAYVPSTSLELPVLDVTFPLDQVLFLHADGESEQTSLLQALGSCAICVRLRQPCAIYTVNRSATIVEYGADGLIAGAGTNEIVMTLVSLLNAVDPPKPPAAPANHQDDFVDSSVELQASSAGNAPDAPADQEAPPDRASSSDHVVSAQATR